MTFGQDDDQRFAPSFSGRRSDAHGGVDAGTVAVEGDHRRSAMQPEDIAQLQWGQLPSGLGQRAEEVAGAGLYGRHGNGHGVESPLHDHRLTLSRRRWQRLVESHRLVVEVGARRVLVLRPARVPDVAADEAGDLPVAVADGNEHPLAVVIGEPRPRRGPVGQPGVHQFVGTEAQAAEPPDQPVGPSRGVAHLPPSGPLLQPPHLDASPGQVHITTLVEGVTAVIAPRRPQRLAYPLDRGPPEIRPLTTTPGPANSTGGTAKDRCGTSAGPGASPGVGQRPPAVEDRHGLTPAHTLASAHPLDHVRADRVAVTLARRAGEAEPDVAVEVQPHRRGPVGMAVARHRAAHCHRIRPKPVDREPGSPGHVDQAVPGLGLLDRGKTAHRPTDATGSEKPSVAAASASTNRCPSAHHWPERSA